MVKQSNDDAEEPAQGQENSEWQRPRWNGGGLARWVGLGHNYKELSYRLELR